MSPAPAGGRWERLEELFLAAADLPLDERSLYLDRECAGDAALRAELEAMLAEDTSSSTAFLGGLVEQEAAQVAGGAGQRIGPYRVLGVLGSGGMGAVYRAVRDDGVYEKEVAIKVLQMGLDTPHARARFRQERQILAGLEHPSIARLIDGGETEAGLPYLVLELVDGQDIVTWCKARGLGVEARLRLFLAVCAAVQAAHQSLIVHRDLKPGNILVTGDGAVKLLDFGIAKLLDSGAERTATMLTALTPQYASPEQVRGEAITTSSDVYSLGVVLYQMLTGGLPYEIRTMAPMDIDRAVCQTVPGPAGISGDIDNILAMALRKEPLRRYASVRELAEDIERSLENLPVRARPDTVLYRAGKFVRRHRLMVAAAVVTAVSLVAGAGVALRQAAIAERRFAEVRKLANRFLFDFDAAIATVPGTTKAREMVVSTALEYLNRLSDEAHGDAGLLEELAAAYQKVGDVQGNPSEASLGATRAALDSYRKSRAIREQLLALRPGDGKTLRQLADLRLLEGSVLRTLGEARESGECIRKGAELADRALAQKPDDPALLFLVGSAWYRRGEDRRAFANGPEAQAAFERAAATFRRVRGQPRFENALASTEGRLGFTLLEQGRPEEALGHMQTAVEIRRRLAGIRPPVTAYRRGLAIALLQLGNAYGTPLGISLGDERAAERCYRESIALFEELARQDAHNRTVQDDLLLVRLSLGAVLPAREAVRVFGEAIETMARSGVDTTRADIRENVALARLGRARALVEVGRAREAAVELERAQAAVKQGHTSSYDAAAVAALEARIRLAEGRRAEARAVLETALRAFDGRGVEALGFVELRDLAALLAGMTRVAPAEAHQWRERERAVWAEWQRRNGYAPVARRRLAELERL